MLLKTPNGNTWTCGKSVVKWVFYHNGKIIHAVESHGIYGHIENQSRGLETLYLDEAKRANKENLSRTDNFYVNHKTGFGQGVCLYIHCPKYRIEKIEKTYRTKIEDYDRLTVGISCSLSYEDTIYPEFHIDIYKGQKETEFGKSCRLTAFALEADGIDIKNFDVEKYAALYGFPKRIKEAKYVLLNSEEVEKWYNEDREGTPPEPIRQTLTLEQAEELHRQGKIDTYWTQNTEEVVVLRVERTFRLNNPSDYWQKITTSLN